MFAFCLLDPERGLAFFCRDRLGIKPLYLTRPRAGGLLFASEVRALLAAGPELVPPRLRRSSVESFLAQGAVMSEASIVDGIELLPPGEALLCDFDGKPIRSVAYWSVAFGHSDGALARPADGTPEETSRNWRGRTHSPAPWRSELIADLGAALRGSLRKLLCADVPVGLFLSSGIDSTAVAALASEVSAEPLRTLAIGFDVDELDESDGAELSAREFGTLHRRIPLSGSLVLEAFDDVLAAVDQPTVDGFNTFHISRAAHEAGLTVALSGLGGDELFGGYRSFTDVPRALRIRQITAKLGETPLSLLRSALQLSHQLPGLKRRGRALSKLGAVFGGPADLTSLYFLRRELTPPARRRALQPLPAASDPELGVEHTLLERQRRAVEGREPLDQIATLEVSNYMRHMLLRDSDVFGMANGLEIRVPLLEHYVVAQAARARSEWRKADPRLKPLLIDAVGPRLPARVTTGKKRGFTLPWRVWLQGPLKQRAEAGIHEGRWRDLGFDERGVHESWQRFASGDSSVSELEILALLVLESYARRQRLAA
jgi:asparagine synthase (glutamine-hydrolysing)